MTEIAVADFAASVAFYRDALGLPVTMIDAANGFALFAGRVAVKRGTPTPGGVTLHFEVADLDAELGRLAGRGVTAGGVKESREGYRRAFVSDPDGYRVGLFAWIRGERPA